MNTKITLIILMFILHLNLNASDQEMSDLYKYVIEDYYNESLREGYITEQDTMYLIWCFGDYAENCFEYDIQLNSKKILFKMPKVSENNPLSTVCRLTVPELAGQFIIISIIPYGLSYNKETEDLYLIRASTIIYQFMYDKKKSKYIFKSKKKYVI